MIKQFRSWVKPLILPSCIYLAGIIIFSVMNYYQNRKNQLAIIDARLEQTVRSFNHVIPNEFFDRAIAKNSILPNEDSALSLKLSEYAKKMNVAYVYSLTKFNDSIFFTSGSSTDEEIKNKDLLTYWLPYPEAPELFKQAFENDTPVFAEYKDRWGAFRSIIYPQRSPAGKKYLIGIDLKIEYIQKLLLLQIPISITYGLFFLILAVPFISGTSKLFQQYVQELKVEVNERREAQQKLEEMNENLEEIVQQRTQELAETNKNLEAEIEERKQIETELKKTESKLRELNATKDKFLSIIAHDLKNPFHTILGLCDLLESDLKEMNTNSIRKIHRLIMQSSTKGYELLVNLLDWSRSLTGRITWTPRLINIREAVRSNMEYTANLAVDKKIILFDKTDEKSVVFADLNMINTVLRNLLSNAIKFTSSGGWVAVYSKKIDRKIEITVEDNGVGMKKEDCKRLFRLDVNFTTMGTANEIGTGLGLILCKEFIEKNNGNIRVESEETKGSSFIFTLPEG